MIRNILFWEDEACSSYLDMAAVCVYYWNRQRKGKASVTTKVILCRVPENETGCLGCPLQPLVSPGACPPFSPQKGCF